MSSNSIKISAPATVSNVGCGFDIMGFAINLVSDEIILRLKDSKGLKISKITGDNKVIPLDTNKNTATKGILKILSLLKLDLGLEIEIHKKIGIGSGLGSSAASAVGGVVALNELLGRPLTNDELLSFALEGEKIASNAIHADNVAPCLYGGFILIRAYNPPDIIGIAAPQGLYTTVVLPKIEIKTSAARKILPKSIPLKTGIKQWGNVGGLVAGLLGNNLDLVGRSVVDNVAEPVRAKLIPGYTAIKEAAFANGAIACSISGSGPAIFAFSKSKAVAEKIGNAMKKEVSKKKIKSSVYVSAISKTGARVIE